MQLQLIRNATVLLRYAGHALLVDPMLGARHTLPSFAGQEANPTADLPFPAEQVVAPAELALISHLHPDHYDGAAARLLPRELPLVCRAGDEEVLRSDGFQQVTPLSTAITWHGIQIQPAPGRHGSGPILDRMGEVTGVVLRAAGEPTVYWAGDTVLYEEVLGTIASVQPDVIVTHSGGAAFGGTLIIMDAQQTLEVARAAPQATVVATHLEALDHCATTRQMLRDAATAAGISSTRLRLPQDGEALTLEAARA
ncbi:MBL fold metallo-hydrolase [Deinococcus navajonensis]|uniref:MBL fold metallo-hydrolase n=1 Tax=Deinococcus navajonensis TaxID=309884 RepID=A0ABV8XL10_9DEIO